MYTVFISFPPVSFPFPMKYILFANIDSKVYYVTTRVKKHHRFPIVNILVSHLLCSHLKS